MSTSYLYEPLPDVEPAAAAPQRAHRRLLARRAPRHPATVKRGHRVYPAYARATARCAGGRSAVTPDDVATDQRSRRGDPDVALALLAARAARRRRWWWNRPTACRALGPPRGARVVHTVPLPDLRFDLDAVRPR